MVPAKENEDESVCATRTGVAPPLATGTYTRAMPAAPPNETEDESSATWHSDMDDSSFDSNDGDEGGHPGTAANPLVLDADAVPKARTRALVTIMPRMKCGAPQPSADIVQAAIVAKPRPMVRMPGPAPPPDPPTARHLAEQVKTWQRQSTSHTNAWHGFVRSRGSTNFDPVRHDIQLLMDFMRWSCGLQAPLGTADGPPQSRQRLKTPPRRPQQIGDAAGDEEQSDDETWGDWTPDGRQSCGPRALRIGGDAGDVGGAWKSLDREEQSDDETWGEWTPAGRQYCGPRPIGGDAGDAGLAWKSPGGLHGEDDDEYDEWWGDWKPN